MAERVTLPDGKTYAVDYRDDFETVKEEWSEYLVDDRIRVRFKGVAGRIGLLLDPETKEQVKNADGTPAVVVVSQNVVLAQDLGRSEN